MRKNGRSINFFLGKKWNVRLQNMVVSNLWIGWWKVCLMDGGCDFVSSKELERNGKKCHHHKNKRNGQQNASICLFLSLLGSPPPSSSHVLLNISMVRPFAVCSSTGNPQASSWSLTVYFFGCFPRLMLCFCSFPLLPGSLPWPFEASVGLCFLWTGLYLHTSCRILVLPDDSE